MKTVQTVLREADRDRLLDALACNILYDTKLLLELKDRTIADIQEACRNHMNAFVEYLLSLDAAPSDHLVLYMCEASSFDKAYNHEEKRQTKFGKISMLLHMALSFSIGARRWDTLWRITS